MSKPQQPQFTKQLLHPRYWLLWLGFGCVWLISWLPYRLQVFMGKGLGLLLGKVLSKRTRIARRNLQLCYPEMSEHAREALLRENLKHTGISLFETGMAWFWPQWRINKHMQIEGAEHIHAAQQQERGILLLSCHFLSLEMGGRIFSSQYESVGFYRKNRNPVMEFMQCYGRTRGKASLIQRTNVRGAFRALRQKKMLWYAPDQDLGRQRSVFVPFMHVRDTATAPAAGVMAKSSNAIVVPFYQIREKDGYRVVVLPPLNDFPSGDEIVDTTRVNQVIEEMVRQHPEQYMWIHRRFKTREDPNAPSHY